jgi:two-component system response regulator FixJ
MQIGELQLEEFEKMSPQKKKIYILDDDKSVLRSLKILMVSYGFEVDTFSSSEKFFTAVPNNANGCLILDIHMPGLNGWDTQQRLTKDGYNLPVIVITADKDDAFKEKALKAGAVGFLQKPFEDHYLLHMVNRVFNKTVDTNV